LLPQGLTTAAAAQLLHHLQLLPWAFTLPRLTDLPRITAWRRQTKQRALVMHLSLRRPTL
jgi:hypothetical protein